MSRATRVTALLGATLLIGALLYLAFAKPWERGLKWQDEQRRYFALRGERGAGGDAGGSELRERRVEVAWQAEGEGVKSVVEKCTTCHLGVTDPAMDDPKLPAEFRTHPPLGSVMRAHPVAKYGCTACHGGDPGDLTMKGHPPRARGELLDVPVDDRNDEFELAIVEGAEAPRWTKVRLADGLVTFATEEELWASLAARARTALGREVVVGRVGSRLRFATSPPAKIAIRFPKPDVAALLGFEPTGAPPRVDQIAVRAPRIPLRTVGDERRAPNGAYVPPDGARGPSVPPNDVERFVRALPRTEAACGTCHTRETHLRERPLPKATTTDVADVRPDDAPGLTEGRALFRELRCDACHSVPRSAARSRPAPPLDGLTAKTTPAWVLRFLRSPRAVAPKTTMPSFWPAPLDATTRAPLAPGSPGRKAWEERMRSETLAITAFLVSRSEATHAASAVARRANVTGASASEGQRLFDVVGCRGCHTTTREAPAPFAAHGRQAAPGLENAGGKLTEDWIAAWLADPKRLFPGATMPDFRLDKRDAASLAKYVTQLREAPASGDASLAVLPDELAILGDRARREEPVLCNVGDVQTSRVACGQRLYDAYGCGSCHGATAEERARGDVTLDGYAARMPTDWGQLVTASRTWAGYTIALLDGPRVFAPATRRMPDYDLSANEIAALTTYLASLDGRAPQPRMDPNVLPDRDAIERGRTLVADLGCRGCHVIEEEGGAYAMVLRAADPTWSPRLGPPSLRREGARVRPEWLFRFLREPGSHGVRPWLHPEWVYGPLPPPDRLAPRMPTFAIDVGETNALVRYFARVDDEEWPFDAPPPNKLSSQDKLRAVLQMNRAPPDGGQCMRCHYAGELPLDRAKANLADLAPDLAGLSTRLRAKWTRGLLSSPESAVPFTSMPRFVEGDASLVTDFLFGLPPHAHLPAPGEELRQAL